MVLNLVGHSNAKDLTGFSGLKEAEPTNFQAFSLKTLIPTQTVLWGHPHSTYIMGTDLFNQF